MESKNEIDSEYSEFESAEEEAYYTTDDDRDLYIKKQEKQLIEKFRNTYNADYIRDLSTEKKRYASKGNIILKRLINNLESPQIKPPYIEGPISFYRIILNCQKRGITKTFYLFGEHHRDTRGNCHPDFEKMEFHDYIDALSKNTYSFTDVYIELPMLKSIKPKIKNRLQDYDINLDTQNRTSFSLDLAIQNMFNDYSIDFKSAFEFQLKIPSRGPGHILESLLYKYQECIQPSTRNSKKCQLMRIHNIDIRSEWGIEIPEYMQFYQGVLWKVILRNDKTSLEKISVLRRIGKPIQEILKIFTQSDEEIVESLFSLFKTNPWIKKEIEKSYFKDEIESFIKNKIIDDFLSEFINSERIPCFKIILSFVKNEVRFKDFQRRKMLLNYSLEKVFLPLAKIDGLAVDMYALSRIFKIYKPKKIQNKNQPLESINVIVYAGHIHIQKYREFLKTIGGEEKYVYENPDYSSCVKMRW